jgi:hypothetical protein
MGTIDSDKKSSYSECDELFIEAIQSALVVEPFHVRQISPERRETLLQSSYVQIGARAVQPPTSESVPTYSHDLHRIDRVFLIQPTMVKFHGKIGLILRSDIIYC